MNKSGQVPPGDVRLTLNVTRDTRKTLKQAAVTVETTMGDLVEQLVQEHLTKMVRAGVRPKRNT